MPNTPPCVVTIAGSDSSGGAGIQADIKTISATGSYAASIITALTAQNTQGVQAIYPLPDSFIEQQITSVFDDLEVRAVKLGMLLNQSIINIVFTMLQKYKLRYVVLDPVMISKSGHTLLEENTIQALTEKLFPLSTLITPNLPECEKLTGMSLNNDADMETAAKKLGDKYAINVLVKGGHLQSAVSADVLYAYADKRFCWFKTPRIRTNNTHGTGCTLASAIASYLAQGSSLHEAIKHGKDYLTHAIKSGARFRYGHGVGPVDHFFNLSSRKL